MNDQQRLDSEARVDLAVLALRRAREDARRGRFTERAPASRRRRVRGRTPPVLLSQALRDLFSASGTSLLWAWRSVSEASPLPDWHSVAGPLAKHVIPTAFDSETGTLTLASATEAWLTQTRILADRLTQRLKRRARCGHCAPYPRGEAGLFRGPAATPDTAQPTRTAGADGNAARSRHRGGSEPASASTPP
ncbi:uncharacterized protein DUF721 [Streptomyces sp. Ag82_O1-15]|uniref:DciA family protein n=1 Tax=Streptomyces sp. Ag82_O1-15 TaxID=1938855 RepID=UPI000BC3E8CC|nr:uncharacterized protein DUF721 [Streptomyces sp. Ag82_O1-15]